MALERITIAMKAKAFKWESTPAGRVAYLTLRTETNEEVTIPLGHLDDDWNPILIGAVGGEHTLIVAVE